MILREGNDTQLSVVMMVMMSMSSTMRGSQKIPFSEVLAYASNMCPKNSKPDNCLSRNEWNKMTPSQKEALIPKK
jgi:hypothetical protein